MDLTLTERNSIRGMLADKQSAKTIAEMFECSVQDVEALAKPKAVRAAPHLSSTKRLNELLKKPVSSQSIHHNNKITIASQSHCASKPASPSL